MIPGALRNPLGSGFEIPPPKHQGLFDGGGSTILSGGSKLASTAVKGSKNLPRIGGGLEKGGKFLGKAFLAAGILNGMYAAAQCYLDKSGGTQ